MNINFVKNCAWNLRVEVFMFRFVKTVVIGTILFQSHDVYAEEPTVEEILRKADDLFRREHSMVTMEMTVKTARYERNMKMQAVSYGTEKQ